MPATHPGRWLLAGTLLTLLLLGLGLRVGSYATNYAFILKALRQYDPTDPAQLVLVQLQLRLSRLLLAWLAGASLALSGYLLQTLVTNPLADPYLLGTALLGTASGASLGAIITYLFFPALTLGGLYLPPLAALAGGLLATVLVVAIGSRRGRVLPAPLLLGGGSSGRAGGGLAHYVFEGRPGQFADGGFLGVRVV